MKIPSIQFDAHHRPGHPREPQRERRDNFLPRCALIRGMYETSYADWCVAWQLTPLSLRDSLGRPRRGI